MHRTIWSTQERLSPTEGFWGKATASIDWCEENFKVSPYVAEFFNTFSNLAFIALALHGIQRTRQERLPTRFTVVYAGIALIGVGSFLFHATLQYQWQLLDELPMIYASSLVTLLLFKTEPDSRLETGLPFLILYDVGFTLAYLRWPNPVFHQTVYGVVQTITTIRGWWLMTYRMNATPLAQQRCREARALTNIGSLMFVGAFLIWNIDNQYCDALSDLKDKLGFPFSGILELHALWHFGTGGGGYVVVAGLEMLTLSLMDSPGNYEIKYTWGFLPWIGRTKQGWAALEGVSSKAQGKKTT